MGAPCIELILFYSAYLLPIQLYQGFLSVLEGSACKCNLIKYDPLIGKMEITDLRQQPWNLNLIKNVEDFSDFSDSKSVKSLSFSTLLLINKKYTSQFRRNKNIVHTSSDNWFKWPRCKSGIAIQCHLKLR